MPRKPHCAPAPTLQGAGNQRPPGKEASHHAGEVREPGRAVRAELPRVRRPGAVRGEAGERLDVDHLCPVRRAGRTRSAAASRASASGAATSSRSSPTTASSGPSRATPPTASGASFVPMYQAQLAKEWHFILEDCGAKVVIGATDAIVATLRGMQPELPGAPARDRARAARVRRPFLRGAPGGRTAATGAGGAPVVRRRRRPHLHLRHHRDAEGRDPEPRQHHLERERDARRSSRSPDDRSLAFLPWAHSFGQTCELHCLLSMGCSLAINDDVKNLVANLAEVKPTILFAVPRIFNRLYDGVNAQIADKPGVIQWLFKHGIEVAKRKAKRRVARSSRRRPAGARRPPHLLDGPRSASAGDSSTRSAAAPRSARRWRSSSTRSASRSTRATASPRPARSSPRTIPAIARSAASASPIPGVSIQIDRSVTDDPVNGEIIVHGPNVMQGYHNRPDENAAVLMEDDGFRTRRPGPPRRRRLPLHHRPHQGAVQAGERQVRRAVAARGEAEALALHRQRDDLRRQQAAQRRAGDSRRGGGTRLGVEAGRGDAGRSAHDEQVRQLIRSEIETLSKELKGYERVQNFIIVLEDFTTDNGMLTPTLKLKRRVVLERYGADLDALY